MMAVHVNADLVSCPNCRANMSGNAAVVAYFGFLPAASVSRAASEAYSSAHSQDETTTLITCESYTVNTQVDGHLSMVVDIGAFVNDFGEKLARALARAGGRYGHSSSQHQLGHPLHIHGVGQGGQVCK